jgi:hypothetical protein
MAFHIRDPETDALVSERAEFDTLPRTARTFP